MLTNVTDVKVFRFWNDNTNIESLYTHGEKMSLLSRYYHRKYMVKTLSERMSNYTGNEGIENLANDVNEVRSLLSTVNETYESATSGFFASSGQLIDLGFEAN